jgi:hypothetical protein
MGNIEDLHKTAQDFIAPELKALSVRLGALEKEMNRRFDSAEKVAKVRHEIILATMATHQASTMIALEMERRLSKLEALQIERRRS